MINFPSEGIGRRYLWCKYYDVCLYGACIKDWKSFNCEVCECQDLGFFDFMESVSIPEIDDVELFFEVDQEIESVFLTEDLLVKETKSWLLTEK